MSKPAIPIDSNELVARVLCYLIEQVEAGNVDDLLSAGFTGEDIANLRTLSVADVLRIAGTQGLVDAHVNQARLSASLQALLNAKAESAQITYLARAGATVGILCSIFRITADDAQGHLAALGVPGAAGRPALPDTNVRDQIHQWWAANQPLPVRQRWIELHKAWPQFSLSALYAVVNEFDL